MGAEKFNVKPILLTLTKNFNSIPIDVISDIKNLNSIANNPEIWEINFQGKTNRIL